MASVEKTRKAFWQLYADTFHCKDTVSDMRGHIWADNKIFKSLKILKKNLFKETELK